MFAEKKHFLASSYYTTIVSNKKLLVTSASLLVTSALLVVTRSYVRGSWHHYETWSDCAELAAVWGTELRFALGSPVDPKDRWDRPTR